ncbi:MAG: hypothetical protein F6J89_33695 [Symploca sp. SIO1C4]|uniref:Uncharacterized protein n=1 Tax=Symploca sp. SIO1C4 TaxID=2607765 RepID=A0A6B3NGP2_9CYAN|nr:hypothetical protein [Symploca sp. SIO1C4]
MTASSEKKPYATSGRYLPTWRELNQDSSPEAEAVLFALWRNAPAWKKLQMMDSLNQTARQLTLHGLQERYPNASEAELRWRLNATFLGEELTQTVYGSMPTAGNGR